MGFVLLAVTSSLAGLIDAMTGDGGLVQIPALFSAHPNIASAMLIDTDKVAPVSDTTTAAAYYGHTVRVYWGATTPTAVAAFVFSLLGAWALTRIPAESLRRALPFVLAVSLVYMVAKKSLSTDHVPSLKNWREFAAALLIGAAISLYDGVFDPSTDSFLMVVFMCVFEYDFLHASASIEIVNLATNVAVLLLLAVKGHVWWQLGLVMMVANVAGNQIGSHLALRRGSRFVHKVFIVVVLVLVLKMAYDAFIR